MYPRISWVEGRTPSLANAREAIHTTERPNITQEQHCVRQHQHRQCLDPEAITQQRETTGHVGN